MRPNGTSAAATPRPECAYDLVGIGAGPFNLGLAALGSTVAGLNFALFDAEPELRWHRGLGFEDSRLQVNFLADLVTLVDPTHPCSFLEYLRSKDRLWAFYVRERFHPSRHEFEDYLRWAAARLPQVHYSHRVEAVRWSEADGAFLLRVVTPDGSHPPVLARNLVLGIGTEPYVPDALRGLPADRLVRAGDYLGRLCAVTRARHITLVGSGQSGGEIALDLLRRNLSGGLALHWLTGAESFAPLDYTKLVLEMTTPSYVRYFHGLEESTRDALVAGQWRHYKGISSDTLEQIHDLLYRRELAVGLAPVELSCGTEVRSASATARGVVLHCLHHDTGTTFEHETSLVVAATGYKPRVPQFLEPIAAWIRRDASGRFRVRLDHSLEIERPVTGRIFVSHSDLHSHGVAAPDLGFCAYRNAVILNTICERQVYPLPQRTCFTRFEPPRPLAPDREPRVRAPLEAEPSAALPASSLPGMLSSAGAPALARASSRSR